MHLQKVLKRFGLNDKEAKIYMVSLRLGDATLSEIAKSAQMPRTSCNEVIKTLSSKGLVNVLKLGSKRSQYRAENPEKFIIALREQEAALREIMPELKSQYRSSGKKPSIYFYEGANEINLILEDILARQYPLLATTSIDHAVDVLGDSFLDFVQRRHQKHLRVKLLTHKSEKSLILKERDILESRNTKFLSSDATFKTATFIYGDRVAIIDLQAQYPFGLIIEDTNIAEAQRILFETIWEKISA